MYVRGAKLNYLRLFRKVRNLRSVQLIIITQLTISSTQIVKEITINLQIVKKFNKT